MIEALAKAVETFKEIPQRKEMPADILKAPGINKAPPWENKNALPYERLPVKETPPWETKELHPLTDEDREHIKKEAGWSDKIIDAIKIKEEYEVYEKAGLGEAEIDGRICLIRPDLDLDYVAPKAGKTNRELISIGRVPYDSKTGEKITLHHIGQKFDAPLAELTEITEHAGNTSILHTSGDPSWRTDQEKANEYKNHQLPNHWKARAGGSE